MHHKCASLLHNFSALPLSLYLSLAVVLWYEDKKTKTWLCFLPENTAVLELVHNHKIFDSRCLTSDFQDVTCQLPDS